MNARNSDAVYVNTKEVRHFLEFQYTCFKSHKLFLKVCFTLEKNMFSQSIKFFTLDEVLERNLISVSLRLHHV